MEWPELTINDLVINVQSGFAEGNKKVVGGVNQLRMNNITASGELDLTLLRTVSADENKIRKYSLVPGDIIFNNTNSLKLVGKTAFFDITGDYLYSNHLTRIQVDQKKVRPRYVSLYLLYLFSTGYFEQICKSWVNQSAVSREKLLGVSIKVPSLETQDELISDFEVVFEHYKAMKKQQEVVSKALNLLPRVVLRKAFGDENLI